MESDKHPCGLRGCKTAKVKVEGQKKLESILFFLCEMPHGCTISYLKALTNLSGIFSSKGQSSSFEVCYLSQRTLDPGKESSRVFS